MADDNKPLPVFSPADGRTVVGHATTAAGVRQVLARLGWRQDPGFRLRVWRRTPLMQEILGLADGWCFAFGHDSQC
jgi:hypothetical protein